MGVWCLATQSVRIALTFPSTLFFCFVLCFFAFKNDLVVKWLIICLPVRGIWVWSLVWKDSTCCRAAKRVRYNCWPRAPQLLRSPSPGACALQQENPLQWEAGIPPWRGAPHTAHSLQLEKALAQQWRPRIAKKKINKINKEINLKRYIYKDLYWGSIG